MIFKFQRIPRQGSFHRIEKPRRDREFETHVLTGDRMGESESTRVQTQSVKTALPRAILAVARYGMPHLR